MSQRFGRAPSSSAQFQVRLALPRDRRQIRLLLQDDRRSTGCSPLWRVFGLGLGLSFSLWGLFAAGLPVFGLGLLVLSGLALASWVNLRLLEDWPYYWVIAQGPALIGCAKLTRCGQQWVLSDVVVAVAWRRLGWGTRLLAVVMQSVEEPIYLTCLPELTRFYERFGFESALLPLASQLKRELGVQNPRFQVLWRPDRTHLDLRERRQTQ